jgi:hypothetical protein
VAGATLASSAPNCGRQKCDLLGSFQMTTSLIAGYCCRSGSRRVDVRASDAWDEKPSGWFTRDEVRDQLEAYRRANPGTLFAGVSVVETPTR